MGGSIAARLGRRGAMVLAAVAVAAGGVLATIVPASADTGPLFGSYDCAYYNWAPGWWQQNVVCIQNQNNWGGGADADVWNNSQQWQHYDFNLACDTGRYGDYGSFWTAPGGNNTFWFQVGAAGYCRVGLYDYGGSQWLYSPTQDLTG